MSLEAKYNQLLDEKETLLRVIRQLKATVHKQHLLMVQVELEERIKDLPAASQERLSKAFPGTDLGGLKQAIKAEKRGA